MEIEDTQGTAAAIDTSAQQTPQPEQVLDLDGVSKFTVSGQEYTPEQLSKIFNEHKRFSEDQSSYSKNKIYYDNLQIDLRNVKADPSLVDRFKEQYPKEFHKYLDVIIEEKRQEQAAAPQAAGLPKEFLNEFGQLKSQLSSVMQENHQAKVEASLAKIDTLLKPLMDKFDMALEDQVLARAETVLNAGGKVSDKMWERFARESHETNEKRWNDRQAAKMKIQTDKGQRARDTAQGGHSPGHAPVQPRTFAEAEAEMMKSMRGNR